MRKPILMAWIGLIFASVLFTACDIEQAETVVSLNVPLGLSVSIYSRTTNVLFGISTNTNTFNIVRLQFWGHNNEAFFSGYNIFAADNLYDLTNELTNPAGSYRKIPDSYQKASYLPSTNFVTNITPTNTNITTNISYPSLDLSYDTEEVDETTRYTVDIYYDEGFSNFVHGQEYYFHIKAYSIVYDTYGLPGNFTNMIYTTNYISD